MKFKLVERGNPLKKEEPKKFYAQPVYADKVNQKQLAKQLADLSSLSAGDVANVIQNLVEEFPKILTRGGIVQLGDFGSFRVTLSSKGAEAKGDFSTETITPKISFLPGVELKKQLASMKYQQE
ncbi:MAG: DNA-binding protein [candidate division SR1 bacterium]|nr:MAG: DNA-binding protein [candidate division SR1 bacterium]